MANKNPYVSTLLKRLAEHNNVQINERVKELGESPSKDDVVAVFKDFNLELPTMRRKLNDAEKAERKQQREQKKAEKEEKEKQIIEDKCAALKDVLACGTAEEKEALENVIKSHQKAKLIEQKEIELKELQIRVERLQKEIERLRQ